MALITEDDLLEYFHCQREVILNSMDIVSSFNLDSLGLFNFIIFLEDKSGVDMFNNNIDIDVLTSLDSINDFISYLKK